MADANEGVQSRSLQTPPPFFFVAYKKEDEEVLGIKKNEERNETDFRRVEMVFFLLDSIRFPTQYTGLYLVLLGFTGLGKTGTGVS